MTSYQTKCLRPIEATVSHSVILTKEIAAAALENVEKQIVHEIEQDDADRVCLHTYIAYEPPGITPNYSFPVAYLAQRTFGESDRTKWKRPFNLLAGDKLGKALCDKISSRRLLTVSPWVMHRYNVKWPGYRYDHGLGIAASGLTYDSDQRCVDIIHNEVSRLCHGKYGSDLAAEGSWYDENGELTTERPC